MNVVILAGGSGTRLWPMSRRDRPKQFFPVAGKEPLIRETYQRLLGGFRSDQIYFSATPEFANLIRKEFPDVAGDHLLFEPERRDTGPAMGYVAALLERSDPDEPLAFIPSDHFIGNAELFLECLRIGEEIIRETGSLVDISVQPTFPSTVLGYTQIGPCLGERRSVEIYAFKGHTEKPPLETAQTYLEDGSYLWHANYYMWTPRRFLEAFETYAPETARILRRIQAAVSDEDAEAVRAVYREIPKISFDYAITEKLDPSQVCILKGAFGWSDIGAWDACYIRLAPSAGANVAKGHSVLLDAQRCLVYAPEGKTVAVIGMKDVVVVDTGDALLVCPRGEAQRVKEVVKELERLNHQDAL